MVEADRVPAHAALGRQLVDVVSHEHPLYESPLQTSIGVAARLYVRFDRLWDPEAAGAYLRVMVVNLARSALRRRLVALRYLQREPSREPSVGDVAGATADHEAAISALRHLPRRQRECLVLRYYLDQPEAEIATTLGISSGSVKTHTSRGLATMAKLLGGEAA